MIKSVLVGVSATVLVAGGAAVVASRADVSASVVTTADVLSPSPTVSPRTPRPTHTEATPTAPPFSASVTPSPVANPGHFKYATLAVPAAGIYGLKVVAYRGTPDDEAGTEIQNEGIAAAPYGSWGGVNPGQIGNLVITGHRTAHGEPLAGVPGLKNGDLIKIKTDNATYTYKVSDRLWVSFRDAKSRESQQLPVPGHPGQTATKPAIVLSTCATPEDHARGDYWHDAQGNPTHRIAIVAYQI